MLLARQLTVLALAASRWCGQQGVPQINGQLVETNVRSVEELMNRLSRAYAIGTGLLRNAVITGSISTQSFVSSALQRDWSYNIYLPDNYDTSNHAYPVVYLLHGNGGNEDSWDEGIRVIDGLIQVGKIPPVIAIAPASGGSWWVDTLEPFETAIIQDLIPPVDAAYQYRQGAWGKSFSWLFDGWLRCSKVCSSLPEGVWHSNNFKSCHL